MMEYLLKVEDVWRSYGSVRAVSGVSLELEKGQILGLLGLNGAGKSTLLKLICGVLAPHRGQINIANFDIVEDATAARRHIGFMPEQVPVYNDLTVLEALGFHARIRGVRSGVAEMVERICHACGLDGFEHRLCGHLSHGYRKRLGIAQALVHRPRLLVLDEPSSGLDPVQVKDMRDLIRDMAADCAIIFSSHVLSEVQTLCNQVLILHHGKTLLRQDLAQQSSGFTVLLDNPPPIEQLGTLLNAQINLEGGGRFHIVSDDPGNTRQLLLQHSLDKGWGLRELMPQLSALEQTFLEVVRTTDYADDT